MTATATLDPSPVDAPPFDGAVLAKQTYFNSTEAAWYCGFRVGKYRTEAIARRCFLQWVRDRGIPRVYDGPRSVSFLRRDLDHAKRGGRHAR